MKADCTRCPGICCKWGGNPNLAVRLELDEVNQYSHFALKAGEDYRLKMHMGRCIYLKHGKCSIYERRPKACREYDCTVEAKRIINQSRDPIMGVIVMGITQTVMHEFKTNVRENFPGDS